MKKLTKLLGILLMVALVMSMGAMAFADNDGSITVMNATKGQTYNAYLIFPASPIYDSNNEITAVTYTATKAQTEVDGFTDVFDVIENADGGYTVSKKSDVPDNDVITFIKRNVETLRQGDAIEGSVADNDTVSFEDLAYGYYYISSSLGTLISVDTAGMDVEVVDKNESNPTGPVKVITDEDSSIDENLDQEDVSLEDNNAGVGSVESFSVTFQATNWVQEADHQVAGSGSQNSKKRALEWKFTDTPTNLGIIEDSVAVSVNGTDITANIDDISVDSSTGVLTFTIPWVDENNNFLYETETEGSALIPVVVTYNAEVLNGAAYSIALNHAEITYNLDDSSSVTLGSDTNTTYTWKFKLSKTDENDEPLEGAEFELYYGSAPNDDAPALTFTKDNDGNYVYDPKGSVTHIAPVKASETAAEASATILGLDEADYMLREVIVPTGYNKADDQSVSALTKETNDKLDETSTVAAAETIIKNNKGTVLPSTGGIGTTIFYVVGSVLVIAAGVLLVTKKRMGRD